jgi:hypothetical protein
MSWSWIVIIVIGAAGGGWFAAKRYRDQQSRHRSEGEDLARVRRLVEEDAACFGELLQRLDRDVGVQVAVQVLDEATRADHHTASTCHDSARQKLSQLSDAEEVAAVTETLADGRYALACAQARLAGSPVPEPRVACFFDPRHGPSVTDVVWTRGGHGPRTVPACAHDADLVTRRQAPEIRTVTRGAATLPYWAAGSAFLAYTQGYFAAAPTLEWALHPTTYEATPADSGNAGGLGAGIVGSSGHFDGGGYDGSGGASGGY